MVVGTHDEFKAKRNTVPEGELPLLVARQEAPTARRPTAARDGGRIFGARDVGEKGAVTSGGIGKAAQTR